MSGKRGIFHTVGPLGTWTRANQEWVLDFVHDAVANGRVMGASAPLEYTALPLLAYPSHDVTCGNPA